MVEEMRQSEANIGFGLPHDKFRKQEPRKEKHIRSKAVTKKSFPTTVGRYAPLRIIRRVSS